MFRSVKSVLLAFLLAPEHQSCVTAFGYVLKPVDCFSAVALVAQGIPFPVWFAPLAGVGSAMINMPTGTDARLSKLTSFLNLCQWKQEGLAQHDWLPAIQMAEGNPTLLNMELLTDNAGVTKGCSPVHWVLYFLSVVEPARQQEGLRALKTFLHLSKGHDLNLLKIKSRIFSIEDPVTPLEYLEYLESLPAIHVGEAKEILQAHDLKMEQDAMNENTWKKDEVEALRAMASALTVTLTNMCQNDRASECSILEEKLEGYIKSNNWATAELQDTMLRLQTISDEVRGPPLFAPKCKAELIGDVEFVKQCLGDPQENPKNDGRDGVRTDLNRTEFKGFKKDLTVAIMEVNTDLHALKGSNGQNMTGELDKNELDKNEKKIELIKTQIQALSRLSWNWAPRSSGLRRFLSYFPGNGQSADQNAEEIKAEQNALQIKAEQNAEEIKALQSEFQRKLAMLNNQTRNWRC